MFFLLRTAFWLSIVLILLPSGGGQAPRESAPIGAIDAVSAAGAAVSDMSQFCERQPDACVVGAQAAAVLGQRAQAGAKMVYEFINEKMIQNETGSIKSQAVAAHGGKASQHTLRPADLKPVWRGPVPRKDAQSRMSGRSES
jgi:hypothetical protein